MCVLRPLPWLARPLVCFLLFWASTFHRGRGSPLIATSPKWSTKVDHTYPRRGSCEEVHFLDVNSTQLATNFVPWSRLSPTLIELREGLEALGSCHCLWSCWQGFVWWTSDSQDNEATIPQWKRAHGATEPKGSRFLFEILPQVTTRVQ